MSKKIPGGHGQPGWKQSRGGGAGRSPQPHGPFTWKPNVSGYGKGGPGPGQKGDPPPKGKK